MEAKHLAFLLDCPEKGQAMLFPGYLEDISDRLKNYQEVQDDITRYNVNFSAPLANSKFKLFKKIKLLKNKI